MKMKCPKKCKNCTPSILFEAGKDEFICSGIGTKPHHYKDDVVWLCLKGTKCKGMFEMTDDEALGINAALTGSLFKLKSLQKGIETE